MIDAATETLISLADVPGHLPDRRGGKRPSISCIYRWATARRPRHTAGSTPGWRHQSYIRRSIQRFFERLARGSAGESAPARTSNQRQRASEKANAEFGRGRLVMKLIEKRWSAEEAFLAFSQDHRTTHVSSSHGTDKSPRRPNPVRKQG